MSLGELNLKGLYSIVEGKHRSGCTGANQLFAVHKMAVYTLTHICIHTCTVVHQRVHTKADVVV